MKYTTGFAYKLLDNGIYLTIIAADIWSRIHRSEKSMSSKSSTLTVVRADCEVA